MKSLLGLVRLGAVGWSILYGGLVGARAAQPSTPPTGPGAMSLELPAMKTRGRTTVPQIPASRFTVDPLIAGGAGGVKSATRQNFNYLTIDPAKDWSRPLRGKVKDVTFVSFLAYGSDGTTFDIGGAKLQITAGAKPGYADLVAINPTSPSASLKYSIKLEQHDKVSVAGLPILTVRIDPKAGVWDLFAFDRLVFEDIPFAAAGGAKSFSVHAGRQGAWMCALVLSDENPLCADANRNGIDDKFEKSHNNNALVGPKSPAGTRRQIAQQWKDSQRVANTPSWVVVGPNPDELFASAAK